MASNTPTPHPTDTLDRARLETVESRRGFLITERDRELLAFVAAHPFVLAIQVREWMGAGSSVCYRRLHALTHAGLLSYRRIFHAQPGCFQVTNGGLAVARSDLSKPQIDLRTYVHDAGVVWLWLAAVNGAFGSPTRVLTERELRHLDQKAGPETRRLGFALRGFDRHGRPHTHYPDIMVELANGARVALELELSLKGRRRLQEIFLAYSLGSELRKVVYITDRRVVVKALDETRAMFGLDGCVRVHYLEHAPGDAVQRWVWESLMAGELTR